LRHQKQKFEYTTIVRSRISRTERQCNW